MHGDRRDWSERAADGRRMAPPCFSLAVAVALWVAAASVSGHGWLARQTAAETAGGLRAAPLLVSRASRGSAALPNTANNRAGEHDLRAATVAEHDSAPSPTAALNQPDAPRPCPSPPPESSRLRPPRPRSRLVGEGRPLPPELSAHDGLTSCYLLLLCPKTVVEWRRAELASRRKDAGAGLK